MAQVCDSCVKSGLEDYQRMGIRFFSNASPIPEHVFPFCFYTVGGTPMPGRRKIGDTVVDVIPNTDSSIRIQELLRIALKASIRIKVSASIFLKLKLL